MGKMENMEVTTPQERPPITKGQIIFAHTFLVYQQLSSITVYTLGKIIMAQGLAASALVVMRLGVATPFMLVASYYATRRFFPEKRFILWMILSGLLSVVFTQALLSFGLTRTTSANTSIINAPCTPLFTTAISIIRGTDKLNVSKALGFTVSIVGALILLEIENFTFEGKAIGNLMVIASAFASSCNTHVQRKMLDEGAHPIELIAHTTLYGLLGFIAVFAHVGLFHADSWNISTISMIEIILIGVFGTAIPWTGGTYALKNTTPMIVSMYVVLQPPVAAFIGLLLGERYTWHQAVGSILILLGLFFVIANEQAKVVVTAIFNRVVGKNNKKFQRLVQEGESEGDEESVPPTELVTLKISIGQDGASTGVETEDGIVYTFDDQPTNDNMLLENEKREAAP